MWALFEHWSVGDPEKDHPKPGDVHFQHAHAAAQVDLLAGSAAPSAADDSLSGALGGSKVAHGLLMFFAWGVFFPGAAMAARFLKPLGGPLFFRAHLMGNFVGVACCIAGFATIYRRAPKSLSAPVLVILNGRDRG